MTSPEDRQARKQGLREINVPENPEVDIIAVPGLGTDPEHCWQLRKPGEKKFNWITDKEGLATPFKEARILLYTYASAWRGRHKIVNPFESIVEVLLMGLLHHREGVIDRPIIFIGHSMGGLVIAQALIELDSDRKRYGHMLACVTGCLFFGTPFGGTSLGTIAAMSISVERAFCNPAEDALGLLRIMEPDSPFLAQLSQNLKQLASGVHLPISLYCFYELNRIDAEEMATKFAEGPAAYVMKSLIDQWLEMNASTMLVSEASATLCANQKTVGLDSGHRDLVQFESAHDSKYILVTRRLQELVRDARSNARVRMIAYSKTSLLPEAVDILRGCLESGLRSKHEAILKTFEKAPRSQILHDDNYREWSSEGVSEMTVMLVFWLIGKRGTGKTSASLSIVSSIRDKIRERQSHKRTKPAPLVAFFLCDSTPVGSEPLELVKSLILQLINQNYLLADYAKHMLDKELYQATPRKDSDTSYDDTKGTMTLQNFWNCLKDMLNDDSIGAVYLIINNVHLLKRCQQSSTLIALIDEYFRAVANPGSGYRPLRVRRWLFTSVRHRGSDSRFKDLELTTSKLSYVTDLNNTNYTNRFPGAQYVTERLGQLWEKQSYTLVQVYTIRDLMQEHAGDRHWTDIQCIRLGALEKGCSTERIVEVLDPSNIFDSDQLVRHCWSTILERDPQDKHDLTQLLDALGMAFRPPSILELSVLSEINDVEKVERLVLQCTPMLVLVYCNSEVRVVKFSHAKFKEEFPWASETPSTPTYGEDVLTPTILHLHGKLALRCLAFMEASHTPVQSSAATAAIERNGGIEEQLAAPSCSYPWEFWMSHAIRADKELAEWLVRGLKTFWGESSLRREWSRRYLSTALSIHDEISPESMTALHTAAAFNYDHLVGELISSGHRHELAVFNGNGYTPLHVAAALNHTETLDVILAECQVSDIDMGQADTGTALHAAALQGQVVAMELLIHRGANPNAVCSRFGPVINAAIRSGSNKAVQVLLDSKRHCDLEFCDARFLPPLALSAALSEKSVFRDILNGGHGKWTAEAYRRALREACCRDKGDSVDVLLADQKTTESLDDDTLRQAMMIAATEDKWNCVAKIFDFRPNVAGADVFYLAAVTTKDIETANKLLCKIWKASSTTIPPEAINAALYQATDYEKGPTVKWLLHDCGADANATDVKPTMLHQDCFLRDPTQRFGNALSAAAWDGSLEIVKLLLECNRPAQVDSHTGCALQLAAQRGFVKVVAYLLEKGADINRIPQDDPNYQGPEFRDGTALQVACRFGWTEVVEILLRKGADPNLGRGSWQRPILAATTQNWPEILRLLLDQKPRIDVNVRGERGSSVSTPLINAAIFMSAKATQSLIEAGAEVNQVDADNNTAIILAAKKGNADILRLLIKNKASFLHESPESGFALDVAAKLGHVECVRVLAETLSPVCRAINKVIASGNTSMQDLVERPKDNHRIVDMKEILVLEQENANLKRQKDEFERCRREWAKMVETTQNAQNEARICRDQMKRLKDDMDEREKSLGPRESRVQLTEAGFKKTMEEWQKSNAELSTSLGTLQDRYNNDTTKLQEEYNKAEVARKKLLTELDYIRAMENSLKSDRNKLKNENARLAAENAHLKGTSEQPEDSAGQPPSLPQRPSNGETSSSNTGSIAAERPARSTKDALKEGWKIFKGPDQKK